MKTFKTFVKGVKRGLDARAKATDHFDKAGDPKNPNASKDLRRAVKYHNVVHKEDVNEALDTHEMAMAHKDKASKALETSDMKSYHSHMSNHHESMGQWHESKGRHSAADREYAKAEEHHEKSLKPDNSKSVGVKNEEVELDEGGIVTPKNMTSMKSPPPGSFAADKASGKYKELNKKFPLPAPKKMVAWQPPVKEETVMEMDNGMGAKLKSIIKQQGVAEGADVEYVVVIRDEHGKRSIRISALTPTDAKEKAEARGYRVLKVKDPREANYFREQGVAEAKQEQTYKVYIQDTDGSERLGNTFVAKSPAHARELAKKQGLKNITSIELKQGVAEGLEDPYDQGFSDGYNGNRKRNPFPLRSKEAEEYDEGWFEGLGEYEKMNPDLDEGVAEGSEKQQYLWHGSRQQISMLEPRQSLDTGGEAGSNQNAIYATSDPKVAIAMGLTTPGSDTGMFPNDPQMVLFSGKIRKGKNVYLHKLPMNGPDGKPQFVQGGNSREFHSIPGVKGIKPVEIIEVPVDKYLNLIRTATPQDLELQKKYMKQQSVAEVVNPDITTGGEYFSGPTPNVRIGDFIFNASLDSGGYRDPNAKGLKITAYDPKNFRKIGWIDFIVHKDKKGNTWLESDETEVDDRYQRKGVATMMYAYAKSLGNDIKPSDLQSDQGIKMWKKWGSDAAHLVGEQGVSEGAPELLKKEMPTHRHAEKLLAQNGVSKDDPDYHHHLNNTIKHLRQFGNIDLINKSDVQGVAEGDTLMKKLHQALLQEGRVKELADDLKTLTDVEFVKKYGKAKAAIRKDMKKVDEGNANSGRRGPIARPDNVPVKQGRIEKLKTGVRHHADSSRYGGYEPENDDNRLLTTQQRSRLNKAVTPDRDIDEAMVGDWTTLKNKTGNTIHIKSDTSQGKKHTFAIHLSKKSPAIESGKLSKTKIKARHDAGEFDKHFNKEAELDEARMSAAVRMQRAIEAQRAKSDASLRRTPSSIPKKEETKKATTDAKTVSEHRVKRRELMAQMLNGR